MGSLVVIFDNTDFTAKENANGNPSNIILLKYEQKSILKRLSFCIIY